MADFFISYTSADREWAHWIGKELQALDHTPHVHEWEIGAGGDIYAWMEQRLDAADHVLCVVSDTYLKAQYSTLERNAALWQAAGARPGFVVLVVVEPVRLPVLSDHLKRCELFGVSDETARSRLREFLTRRTVPDAVAFPGAAFAISNIPLRVPLHFMGRDDALGAIETALKQATAGIAAAVLHGLRGVGKTTLAAAYAERHRGDYRATWWIGAQTGDAARADLVALGVRLRWVGAEDREETALATVLERLGHEGEGILLIFDNAPDASALKPYLPRSGRTNILITSNARAWRGVGATVEIGVWPKSVGADYLLARTGGDGARAAAETLSEALGGLPLAHEQAAAYCERLEKPLGEYLKRFEAAPARLLGDARDAPVEYHDRLTVTKTFALAIDEAAKLHPSAEPLIVCAALLAPEPLPVFLFEEGREKLGDPLAAALADDGLDEALSALRAFALIDRDTIVDERDPAVTTDTIRLHRLVRQVAADRCAGEARTRAQCALIVAMADIYPSNVFEDPATWPRARRLDGPALALVDPVPPGAEEAAARLLNSLALYRHRALGAYAAARRLHERALAIREKTRGASHVDTAESLNNLALLLRAEGDYAGARPLLVRALAIYEQARGPAHAETAMALNNLAGVLQDEGDLSAARALYERALDIAERTFGPEHPATATSLNNLGSMRRAEGDLAAARSLFERALTIDDKTRGADDPDTANVLANLGGVLVAQGDAPAAIPLFERALAIEERLLGPEHPQTVASLDNLAMLFHDQGDLARARPLLERVLAIAEKLAVDGGQRDVAAGLNNLASLLYDQGELDEAHPRFERALAIYETKLGSEHANTNRVRRNLARLLIAADRPDEALSFGRTALAAHAAALGPDHAWTKDSAAVTAQAYDALGQSEEAEALRDRYGLSREPKAVLHSSQ
jgi:tetratricopeptide (TPR) repeat protein